MKAQPGSSHATESPHTGDSQVKERITKASPRTKARIAGVVYLLFLLTTILGEIFMERAGSGLRVVSGDAAATANTILAHESSFQLGFALGLISIACYVVVTALFYQLFKPVSSSLSLTAAFFSLVGIAIWACASLFQLAPLILLKGSPYLSVFNVKQLQALALMFLNLNNQAYSIGVVFEGLFWILIGYLIFRSTFLPRMLGALFAFAGLGYLTFLSPPLTTYLLLYIEVLGTLAEISLILWLLVMGVNAQRWNERASAAGASIRT
jgi:hypothetical protein